MKTTLTVILIAVLVTGCTGRKDSKISSESSKAAQTEIAADTSFNSVVWPQKQGRTIIVGGSGAEIKGFSSQAIQTAINALRAQGNGGTILLTAGSFDITAPVKLYSNMSLKGEGAMTILKKCKGYSSPFAIDADYGELQVTVNDASGFTPGMGVAVYDDEQRSGWALTTARILAVKGNTIYLDDYLLRDYVKSRNGTVSNACSVIEAVEAENIIISDLTVDGSNETNTMIDGCRAGGIYLHKVHRALVENVHVKNFNSDGISWQITEYVTVRKCEVSGCNNSGLHPGTGSPFTVIEENNSHNNGGYGLFVCWRVRNGIARNNDLHDNGINGISTGHKDTAMVFTDNRIFRNGEDGITLRGESENNEPHGTVIRNNIIENNGLKKKSYGISIYCKARNVLIEGNTFRNSTGSNQSAALFLSANSIPAILRNNDTTGMAEGEVVNESGSAVK